MLDHQRSECADPNREQKDWHPVAMTLGRSAPNPSRRPAIVVTLLIGLLLLGLILPGSPFVVAGDGPALGTPGASPVAIEPPADRYWVTYEPCTVARRDFDETMAVVATAFLAPEPPSISLGFDPEVHAFPGGPVTSYQLPDGPVPPAASVDSVVRLLGAGLNCDSTLESVAYWTDDYLIRTVIDDERGGDFTAALWRSANPEETPEPSYPEPITDGNGSQIQAPVTPQFPTPPDRTGEWAYQMYGFRMIDDTHLAAYLEIGNNVSVQTSTSSFEPVQPTFEQTGYAVFEQQPDGTWLINGFESPDTILRQRLFPDGVATPSA